MSKEDKLLKIEVSHKTIVFTVAFLIGIWFLIQIKEIITLIFISIILIAALLKPVEWLTAKKIPRIASVLIVYAILISLMSFAIGIIIPPLISQTTDFASKLPQIISTINDFLIFNSIPTENLSAAISSQIQSFTGNLISISSAIFSSVFLLITLLVFTFYMLLEWKSIIRLATSPFSGAQEKRVSRVISKVQEGLGYWVRGQLSLSIIVGILTYIGLRVLGVPFALPLALIAGMLEIIPIIGPVVASIPAILVGLTISPFLALAVGALFLIVQQLENQIIVPMVMSKFVGLQPAIVVIAILIGAKLASIGGAFLAIPLIVVAKIVFKEFLIEEEKFENGLREN